MKRGQLFSELLNFGCGGSAICTYKVVRVEGYSLLAKRYGDNQLFWFHPSDLKKVSWHNNSNDS